MAQFMLGTQVARAPETMKRAIVALILSFSFGVAQGQTPPPAPTNLHILVAGDLALAANPHSQVVTVGQNATFSVVVAGYGQFSYQWTFDGANVGSNSSSYTRANCQLADDNGRVRVTVSNGTDTAQSLTATLSVNPSVATYYVSPTGQSGNSGLTAGSPWPLSYALSRIGSSNVLMLLPGTYPSIGISKSGTILRSQVKWGATIVGTAGNHGIWTTGDNVVSNVVVDGFEVSHSYIDGVKFNGPNSTVRNCWIHHSGRGNPNWVTNTDTSFTGQGVACHGYNGTTIEYNLIEDNGAWLSHDHGIYISGTNCVVRGNVLRHNLAYAVQLYDTSPGECVNTMVYRNLMYGNGRGAFIVYSWGGYTNYLFNNTILADVNGPVQTDYGVLCMTNNIILSTSGSRLVEEDVGPPVLRDYNVVSQPDSSPGPHDIYVTDAGFVNSANGLYWLSATSPARGAATPNVFALPDFFGNSASSVKDAGAFQYSAALEADIRVLDPPSSYPDYWAVGP